MTAYQWSVILIAGFINALDGYDLVAMAFSANSVVADFSLSDTQLGWLLSSALVGVGFGSFVLSPLADRFGRKRLIVGALAVNIAGLLLTAFADSYAQLLLWRIVTGISIGAILVSVTVVTSEFSNLRFRGLAMSIFSAGYGLGATMCGVLSASLIPDHGWQAVFLAGAILGTAALVLTILAVPESPEILAARGDDTAVQRLARRLHPVDGPVTVSPRAATTNARLTEILTPAFLRTTLLLWLAFALTNLAFYFVSQWTPRLLTAEGLTAQQGVLGGIMLSFGSTIGALVFGALTTRFSARSVLIGFAILAAVSLALFMPSTSVPGLMFATGVAAGMLLSGCITGMYTITPAAYPFPLRATGVGAALGVARLGAILGPVLVGYLLDSGWSPSSLYNGAVVVALAIAVTVAAIRTGSRIDAPSTVN